MVHCRQENQKDPTILEDWESDASFVPDVGLYIGREHINRNRLKSKMKDQSRYDASMPEPLYSVCYLH